MKKSIYIMLAVLLSQFSSSQIYYSHYLNETSEWRFRDYEYLTGGGSGPGMTFAFFNTTYFDGTVNYNGYVYYKMFTASLRFGTVYMSAPTYIREDSNGRFYYLKDIVNGVEQVYLDNNYIQSLQNGSLVPDTAGSSTTCPATVTSIMVDGLSLKKVQGEGYMIEGIGNGYGGTFCNGVVYECFHCPNDSHPKPYKVLYSYTKNGSSYGGSATEAEYSYYPKPQRTDLSASQFNVVKATIFPNPASKSVEIRSDSIIRLIEIFDVEGRGVGTYVNDGLSFTLDLTGYQSGIYFLKVKTDLGVKTEKIIKK